MCPSVEDARKGPYSDPQKSEHTARGTRSMGSPGVKGQGELKPMWASDCAGLLSIGVYRVKRNRWHREQKKEGKRQ